MSSEFHQLRVAATREEIGGGAKSVLFDIPDTLADRFVWQAGQHLTVRFVLDGEEHRRCYTLSSSPHSGDPLRITVKRVSDGRVSTHINDHNEAGATIDVLPPSGDFWLDPGESARRTHYFIGAGSGITPLFSMIHTVLLAEPHSVAHLLYGNRNDESIIFRDELTHLLGGHPDRLTVSHVLSSPALLSWFTPWRRGKIDEAAIGEFIKENAPYAQDTQYYLCGPGDMNNTVRDLLHASYDVPTSRIHSESFGGAQTMKNEAPKSMASSATIHLRGETHTVPVAKGQTLLAAACQAGLQPPFACQAGVCGSCYAQMIAGSAHMRTHPVLDKTQVEQGGILTCQARATSESLEFKFG